MRTLRVGVIGCGVIAPTHAKSFLLQKDVELTWACDLVAPRAEALCTAHGTRQATTDLNVVLDDASVDAVTICTDHASHAPIAEAALAAGKHVLCEKALASSTDGLNRMTEAGHRHPGLVFGGVFQHRFSPVNRALRDLLAEGVFGTMLTLSTDLHCWRAPAYYEKDPWRGTWEREGGSVLINQALHFIDMLLWLGGGASRIAGSYANRTHGSVMETEDTATASLVFNDGARGSFEATCSSHHNWEFALSLVGSEGSVFLKNDEPQGISFKESGATEHVKQRLAEARAAHVDHVGRDYYGYGHPAQIEDFVTAIREGRKPFVTASQARHAVDAVLGVYESERTRRWIDLASFSDA